MSGALVPASSNFQQQGSVDWVELSGRSVNFSVAVLARLSKAGIDPFTLQVGRAICNNFSLDPIAQHRISEAIQALRKFGSYGDIIWFGFGIKYVVTDLAETEQGLTLVALCAALSSTYELLYGARVLRELCSLCKAPQAFSPAIRQWKILVDLCSGILNSGHFALLLDGFCRLVSRGRNAPDLAANRYPTASSTLAEAIITIAQLTNKQLSSATFTGGFDCIWLAAVAESIFSLDVVISKSADTQLYRSRSLDQQPPQLTILYTERLTDSQDQRVVSEKTTLIRSVRTLFVREDGNSLGDPYIFNWRSSWSTILHDTFPGAIDMLLTGEIGYQFSLYVYCVSMIQRDLRESDDTSRHGRLNYLFCGSLVDPPRGHQFLSFASKRLPELSHCLEQDFSPVPQDQLYRRGVAAREVIESSSKAIGGVSLTVLTEVILFFLWITLVSDIDEQIAPSITGLRWLYAYLASNQDNNGFTFDIRACTDQIGLVFRVLSRSAEPFISSGLLAIAGAGVCVYRQVLLDPHLPPDSISRIRVVPGYISHAGALFKTIIGISPRDNHPIFSFDALSTCQSVDAIVQETEKDSELAAAYQVNYTNGRGEKKYLLLSLSALLSKLQPAIRAFNYEDNYMNLSTKALPDYRPCDHERISSCQKKIHGFPLELIDQAARDNAQRLIADSQNLQNPWVCTSMLDTWIGNTVVSVETELLIDRPFIIYLSLMEARRLNVCVFPLIPCLSCMIERGWLAKAKKDIGRLARRVSIRLVAPGRAEAKIQWERRFPDTPQEPSAVSRKKNKRKRTSDPSESSADTSC